MVIKGGKKTCATLCTL